MPRRSKKSKAAEQREQIKTENIDHDTKQIPSRSLEKERLQDMESVPECKVVSGTVHQGDINFQYPGIQCTYISFFSLISMEIKDPLAWIGQDIDSCIRKGNDRFIEYCFEHKMQPTMLLANELPEAINVNGTVFECRQSDIDITTGTLDQSTPDNSRFMSLNIDDALVKGFGASDSCLLICGGQTVAIAKRKNNFFIFDPHSRGKDGLQHHSGNAVLVSLIGIQSLIDFIRRLLIESLGLKPSEQFELVPILISQRCADESKLTIGKSGTDSTNCCLNMDSYQQKPTNSHDKPCVSHDTMIQNLDQHHTFTSIYNQEMDAYFADQKQRDREYRGKRCLKENTDVFSNNTRRDYMRQYMQKRRKNDSFRMCDNLEAVKRMRVILNTEEGRQVNIRRSIEGRQKMLGTEEGRQKHNKRSADYMQKMLSTEEGRQKHNKKSAEGMQKMLSSEEGRLKHNKISADYMQKMLSTEEGRQKHNKRSVKGMQKMLSTEEGRQKHNKRSAEGMQQIRRTKVGRQKNKERAHKGMRYLRMNEKQAHEEHMRRKRKQYGHSFADAVGRFKEAIYSSASYVCSSCHQTWFKHSVKAVASLNTKLIKSYMLNKCLTGYISVENREWICNSCLFNIKQGKVPKLSVINGMKFPQKHAELDLSNLEERLISLRIPFMQIRALNSGGQFSLKGSVVNVPADIEPTIHALPRLRKKSETIPVKLKRMKEFKHAVTTENIRPLAVMAALRTLLNTSQLYKEANISVDDKWNIDESKEVVMDVTSNDQPNSDNESDRFSEIDDDEIPLTTLLDEHSLDKSEILSVAPGEGQKPLSIFKDPNAEYLAFPTIFCGQKRAANSERHVPVYYSDICKWELRCVDRRVALHLPNLFFKMKKLQIEQVCSKVHLAIRRCKTKGKSYTAGYILKDNMGESLVRLDEGYKIFKTIRNSPQYWENQKRDVFAMIRQLGIPTLFLSLSANDLHWSELIITLGKLVDGNDYTDAIESNTLSWQTRSRLVQSDPVTCVRHFDQRVSQFIEIILKSPLSPLGVLKDFFYRVEFQQRGSPHIHMLAWIQDAPKYADNDEAEVLEYIDRVASCSANVRIELKDDLDLQRHKHSRTCRKMGKPVCRFGIPFPPMQTTAIIKPYVGEDKAVYEEYYKTVHEHLNSLEQDETFNEFLEQRWIKRR